jgi:hypothetical protein
MVLEIVVSILVVSFTSLGLSVYCHWRKLQRQEKELEKITKVVIMIVDELSVETRERSCILDIRPMNEPNLDSSDQV